MHNLKKHKVITLINIAGLREGVSHREFEEKMQSLIEKYVYPQVKGALGVTREEFIAGGGFFAYYIQPLTDIHLRSHLQHEIEANSDISYVYIFSAIALAILLISFVNFINLSTAQSATRAREVGIRKTVGSTANELKGQFISEAVFLSILAAVLSLPLIEMLLPFFNNLTGKDLQIPYLANVLTLPFLLGLALVVGFLAGIYPAFYLSSFHPVAVLKGESSGKGRKSWMRNAGQPNSGILITPMTIRVVLKDIEGYDFSKFFDEPLPIFTDMQIDADGNFLFFLSPEDPGEPGLDLYACSSGGELIAETRLDPGPFEVRIDQRFRRLRFAKAGLIGLARLKDDADELPVLFRVVPGAIKS